MNISAIDNYYIRDTFLCVLVSYVYMYVIVIYVLYYHIYIYI